MSAELHVSLDAVLGPEYLTYHQVGRMLGISHATVHLLELRSRKLERRGNPEGVPLLPRPMRVSGTSIAVFRAADVRRFTNLREARTGPILANLPRG